jgi:hypothetical protein
MHACCWRLSASLQQGSQQILAPFPPSLYWLLQEHAGSNISLLIQLGCTPMGQRPTCSAHVPSAAQHGMPLLCGMHGTTSRSSSCKVSTPHGTVRNLVARCKGGIMPKLALGQMSATAALPNPTT